MDNYYDEKQHHRRRELNSQRNAIQIDDQQYKSRGNKKPRLVREMTDDFHPDNSGVSFPCAELPALQPAISMISDDGDTEILAITSPKISERTNPVFSATTADASMHPVPDIANITEWIPTDKPLSVTPLHQRHENHDAMVNRCRAAEPAVDKTILEDLQRTFGNVSPMQWYKIIRFCQKFPYWKHADDLQKEKVMQIKSEFNLTEQQLQRIHEVNQKILYRSSYGVLFVQGGRFFAKTLRNNKKRRSAIKGFSMVKRNGEWETPWETAVRMVELETRYRTGENQEWQSFNMNEQDCHKYLECLMTSIEGTNSLRYIGLFIIRLKPNIQVAIKDFYPADSEKSWYSIAEKAESSTFYTMCPFLKYLREHPDFV